MRRLDPWLLAGLALCGVLLFLVAYGDRIAPNEPLFLLINRPARTERPLPPGEPFLFGSDAVGRDLFSLVIVGARTTLAIVVLAGGARVLVSRPPSAVLAAAVVFAACTSSVVPSTPPSLPAATLAAPTSRSDAPSATTVAGWRRIADIPTPRSEVATALLRDAIFVVGGFGGGRTVEAYLTDRTAGWAAPKREYPLEVDHAMAAATLGDTGSLFVLGGNVQGQPTARVFRFDGDRWTERAAMPLPRSQAAAAVVAGRIYVVGGVTTGSRLLPETFEYDPAADHWRTLAAIPTPRDHLAAAVLDGRVCAIGGRQLSLDANLAAFECYDVPSERWERLPDAPTARGGVGAATVGRRLVVIGGEQPSGTFKQVDIYDAASNSWSRGPDLPTPRHGLGVVAVGTIVYALTGGPTPGGSQTVVCEALTVP